MDAGSERAELERLGFLGFRSLVELVTLSLKPIPEQPGAIAILRDSKRSVELTELPQTIVPSEKWRMSISALSERWVDDSELLYVGEAEESMRTAIRRVAHPSTHQTSPLTRGGLLHWYVRGAQEHLVAWFPNGGSVVADVLADFRRRFGNDPFANIHAV